MSQDSNILSISSLNLRSPKNWKIVARVKNLSAILNGHTGLYFFVDLFDSTGEIRALAYNSEIDRLYKYFEVNSVYSIESGNIKKENPDFPNNNDFKIVFNKSSIIIKKENELNDDVLEHEKIFSKKKCSSVASKSQHNALLEDRRQNSIAKDKVLEIDERLKEILHEELILGVEKIDLNTKKNLIFKTTSDN